MSIVNRILTMPEEVRLVNSDKEIIIQGPKVSLTLAKPPQIKIIQQGNNLLTQFENLADIALAGTTNSLLFNALEGVKTNGGHKKILKVKGTGNRVSLQKEKERLYLEFFLGFSHSIKLDIPTNLEVSCSNNKIIIWGPDKQQVGWLAAKIHDFRRPSVYKKEKGIYYQGEEETIKLKAVKTTNK